MAMQHTSFSSASTPISYDEKPIPKIDSKAAADCLLPPNFKYDPQKVINDLRLASKWADRDSWNPQFCRDTVTNYKNHLRYTLENPLETATTTAATTTPDELLTDVSAQMAAKTLLKSNIHTRQLSKNVRNLERLLGLVKTIPLTDRLSYQLLEANGKAGNIGRTLQILELRGMRGYAPRKREFRLAIQSIVSAALHLRETRNVYVSEGRRQPMIDNPTRWLDCILVNMAERGVPLDIVTVNKMLDCYASMGRTGKATHFFYQVRKEYVDEEVEERFGEVLPINQNGAFKVKLKMNNPPKYYKIPSEMEKIRIEGKNGAKTRLTKESKADYSLALTAAFAFADSLTHGACGHDPIKLNVTSWNTLIKVCCYRGAMWRAMDVLNVTMPRNGVQPDTYTYNTILHGLARVGDRTYMMEFLTTMTNKQIPLDRYTVQGLVDGLLNVGDISGSITIVQDIYNQHQVLPPYTSHLKILEFALGNRLTYEAKRHVYFIQQLWKSDSEDRSVNLVQNSPKLNRLALIKLFERFGEELTDNDFF